MRSRTLAVLARSAQSLALGSVFFTAALGGLVLHGGLPATRRMVASIANQGLGGLFQGRIVVGELTRLSLGRTTEVHVEQAGVLDPEGRAVVLAKGADAR